ncbi:MAG: hypothetical protein IPG61_07815 [bacterium]|nr:hypothetical protein [bacterium]
MRTFIWALAALALPIAALAQIEQPENLLGVYFDESAASSGRTAAPFELFNAYVILSYPTMSAVTGWEAGIDFSDPVHMLPAVLPHGGSNSLAAPQYSVAYTTPLPCGATTVLMTLPMFLSTPETRCIGMFAVDSPSIPGSLPVLFLNDSGRQQAQVDFLGSGNAVAQINGSFPIHGGAWDCAGVVRNEGCTWGVLKSRYR